MQVDRDIFALEILRLTKNKYLLWQQNGTLTQRTVKLPSE